MKLLHVSHYHLLFLAVSNSLSECHGFAAILLLSLIVAGSPSHFLSGLMELLHVSYLLLPLLAVSHCLSGPMKLLHVSHCLLWLLVVCH